MERTIASIFFDDLHFERPLYGGNYTLPSVPKGHQPFFLKIDDRIQMEPLPFISGGGQIPRVIDAPSIANDILEHATEKGFGMTIDCCPGIWIVRDELPEMDEEGKPVMAIVFDLKGKPVERQKMRPATSIEKADMYRIDLDQAQSRQRRYAEWLINQGEALNDKPEQRVLITARMKKAAIYEGKEVEWLQELKHDDTRPCPWCATPVKIGVAKCWKCQGVVDYERYAENEADLAAAVKKAKANRAT